MELRDYDFKIGDWCVYVAECSICSESETLHIEPKVMEVLQILAQAQGKVVSREAIMEKVWHGRYVTDYALNNVIASLRKHLDAQNKSKYVLTRPKLGYQLNCDVELATKTEFAQSSSTSVFSSIAEVPRVTANDPKNNVSIPKNKRNWIVALGLCLLISISLFTSVYPIKSSDNTSHINDKESIAILPFKVATDTPEIAYLAQGISRELIAQMANSPDTIVYDRRSTFALINEDPNNRNPKIVSDKLGANYVLDGAVSKVDEQTTIEVTLYDELGVDLWSSYFLVTSDSIFTLQDDIIAAINTTLKIEPLLLSQAGQYHRSSSPEAFQHLLQGRALNGEGSLEAYQQALVHFKMAVEFDPEYASAYVDLAIGYLVLFGKRSISLEDANIKAKPLIDKALQLHPNLPSAIAAQGIFAMYNGQNNKAIEYYEQALSLDPSLNLARTNLGYLYKNQMRYDEALFHYLLARKQHPLNPGINHSIGQILLNTGQVAQSYKVLEDCTKIAIKSTNCPLELAFLQQLLGESDKANATFEDLLAWYKAEDDYYIIQNKGFHAWWANDSLGAFRYFENLYQKHGEKYSFLVTYAWLNWQQGEAKTFYQHLRMQSELDDAFNTEHQLAALALLAYAVEDCDGMFKYYQQLDDISPIVHAQFTRLIEGFSITLNIAACHISEDQQQLAAPLIEMVEDAISTSDDLTKQLPGVMFIRAKLDSLQGKSINIEALNTAFSSKNYPHSWMLEQDFAFSLQ